MVDQHPFLLKALMGIENKTFPCQQHFKVAYDFLSPQHAHVFFFLNNSFNNKWFDFKIPFLRVCTTIFSLKCFWMGYLKPIVLNFIMFWPQGRHLPYSLINLPNFFIIFPSFFQNISDATRTTTSFNCMHSPSMCVHTSH